MRDDRRFEFPRRVCSQTGFDDPDSLVILNVRPSVSYLPLLRPPGLTAAVDPLQPRTTERIPAARWLLRGLSIGAVRISCYDRLQRR